MKAAQRTYVDGYSFASKREAARYSELELLRKGGDVLHFLMQVGIPISNPIRDADGRLTDPGERYRVDFIVWWKDGRVTWEDVKGHRTESYLRKKRRVEAQRPIRITEV